jgi:hypothetical protein
MGSELRTSATVVHAAGHGHGAIYHAHGTLSVYLAVKRLSQILSRYIPAIKAFYFARNVAWYPISLYLLRLDSAVG